MFLFSSESSQAQCYILLAKLNHYSILLCIPLLLAIVGMSCLWANISGRATDYTDPTTEWQACLTQAQYVTIPLNETLTPVFNKIMEIKSSTTECITDLAFSGGSCSQTDGISCILSIQSQCNAGSPVFPVVEDAQLPVGALLSSLSYLGIQAIIFGYGALMSLRRAFSHPTWLPPTIALVTWCVFAIFTYYTVNPILPVPNQTNATLVTILQYAGSYKKYNDYNEGDNLCRTAYSYIWIYLGLILFLTTIVYFNLILAIIGEIIKLRSQKNDHIELRKTIYPSLLLVPAACFYVLVSISKAYGSGNALDCIGNFNYTTEEAVALGYKLWFPTIWFPFVQPNLDINTVLFISTFMSVLRGYTIQSVSAFRLAFVTAIIYSLASYAPIVGAIQFYITNNFSDDQSCYDYFYLGDTRSFFGYPDENQAKAYCSSFRLALIGNIGLFVTLHLIVLTSLFTFQSNVDRKSLVIEQFDPSKYNLAGSTKSPLNQPLVNESEHGLLYVQN